MHLLIVMLRTKYMEKSCVKKIDRALALICEKCPVCRNARNKQGGISFRLVRSVEERICPFCRAYERVHGKKSHEAFASKP